MPDIPDNHVHQHEGRFKDVEEPFVASGRAERHWVEGWAEQRAQRRSGEVLPNAVGGPREEEQHACVEGEKGALEVGEEDAPSGTAAVENTNDEKKERDDEHLRYKRRLQENVSEVQKSFEQSAIRDVRDADAIDDLDES